MADIDPVIYDSSHPTRPMPVGTIMVEWTGINITNRKGKAVFFPDYPGKSVIVSGTYSAGSPSVAIEGSNRPGAAGNPPTPPADADFSVLNDPSSTTLTFTAQRVEEILENTAWIRPNLTGGDGSTALVCSIVMTKSARK